LNVKGVYRSRASVLLLLFVFLTATACGGQQTSASGGSSQPEPASSATNGTTAVDATKGSASAGSGKTVKAVTPEDVLSEKERTGIPKFSGWNDEGGDVPKVANTADSSVGAIPAVKPFNFGRDPGGPEDKTLYLTVPKLDIYDAPAFDSVTEEKLKESVIHVPATGYPWQEDANTYIAGHRIGYEGTGSWRIFYELDQLAKGDEITLTDANGGEYYYRVTKKVVVGPDAVDIMEPVEGKSLISLQTCTLPDYKERIVVQGELIDKKT
jgi:sortase A